MQCIDKKPNNRTTKVTSFATKDDSKVLVEEKSADCIYCSEKLKVTSFVTSNVLLHWKI